VPPPPTRRPFAPAGEPHVPHRVHQRGVQAAAVCVLQLLPHPLSPGGRRGTGPRRFDTWCLPLACVHPWAFTHFDRSLTPPPTLVPGVTLPHQRVRLTYKDGKKRLAAALLECRKVKRCGTGELESGGCNFVQVRVWCVKFLTIVCVRAVRASVARARGTCPCVIFILCESCIKPWRVSVVCQASAC
jgi:hypothetical protein